MANELFRQRLNEAMHRRHIRGVELAKAVGTSPSNITHYRKGEYAPKLPMMKKMATALGVNPSWLAGIVSDPEPITASEKDLAHNQIEIYISEMTTEQTKKVLKFIEDYIVS